MENDSDDNDGGNVVPMPEMPALAAAIRHAYQRTEKGRSEWVEGTLELGARFADARAKFQNDNIAFGHWCVDEQLDFVTHQDRAALIKMAEHADIARRTLLETRSWSWQLIWAEEIKPGLTNASKTEQESKNRAKPSLEVVKTTSADSEKIDSGHERRTALPRMRVAVPGSEDIIGLFQNKDSRTKINQILGNRGGKDLVALMREVRDTGFLQEHNASITRPSLRLLFPDASVRYANKFDLLKPADRKTVREQILPAVVAHRERLLADPGSIEQIVDEYWKAKREAELAARREAVLTQKLGQMAENERETIMFGEMLWPRLDERRGIYDYNQLRSAIYIFREFQTLADGQSPGSTRIYAKQLMRWFDNYINLFCKAPDGSTPIEVAGIRAITRLVRLLGDLFAANPDGECRYAPSPHVEGEW
jgi:hypothetical protein